MNFKKLEELPHYFQKEYSERKNCGCIQKETITYTLQLDFVGGVNLNNEYIKRYKVYYKPKTYNYWRQNPPIIGESLGMGVTIDELPEVIDNLKKQVEKYA